MANSFFLNVPLNEILEREFQLSYNMGIPFDYDNKEYYEFVWLYERLVDQRKQENESKRQVEGQTSLRNLSPDVLKRMNPDLLHNGDMG